MGTINPLELNKRIQVVQLAQQLFDSGAHYLWGAQGNGQITRGGAVRMRPNSIGTDEETFLYAAYSTSIPNGIQYVCAGRPRKTEIHQRWRGSTLEAANALASQSDQYLWKRFYLDADTVNPSSSSRQTVYGESCLNKLHFDCAGFVRHCFRQTLQIPIGSMRSHAPVVWQQNRSNSGLLTDFDVYPADILYSRDGAHVGIATGRAEYGAPSPNFAIHCFYAMEGVVRTPLTDAPRWATVRRWNIWGT